MAPQSRIFLPLPPELFLSKKGKRVIPKVDLFKFRPNPTGGHRFTKNLSRPFLSFSEELYSLLRIVTGVLFACHGVQLIGGWWIDSGSMPPPGSELWFGGILELACGVLIFVGFITPLAAFIASGQMAMAYFQFHWKFAMDNNFFPIVNHGELAVLYCFLFLFISSKGGGKWSVDHFKLAGLDQNAIESNS